jgi:two-component SAPR family response regulator
MFIFRAMKTRFMFKNLFLFLFILIGSYKVGYSQSYGLGFNSDEVDQNKRTSLDLSPQQQLCFSKNFDISFDISFLRTNKIYFGYVIRIIEDDKRNIDLVYDDETDVFKLVIGEKLSKITFSADKNKLYKQWNNIKIKFDTDNDRITVLSGGRSFTESRLHLKKSNCYKMLFGANSYKQFSTTDVPAMKIRDVKVAEKNTLKFHWPLGEGSGVIAAETVTQNNGAVVNALWVKAAHFYWKQVRNFIVTGSASVAFDPAKEILYVVGNDSLFTYTVKNSLLKGLAYSAGKQNLNIGNQSLFSSRDSTLYNFYTDQKFVTPYDVKKRDWQKKGTHGFITDFIQVNKFLSYADSSLYVFGGYGHHMYRNKVQQYDLRSRLWKDVNIKGDFFTPRYLAASGSNAKQDTAYILGGYGSATGQQVLNAKSLYDMMRFTPKDQTFKKIFELNLKDQNLAFANSLIIDDHTKTYYGLVFPQLKFNSNLRLIKGSLLNNSYTMVGNAIPYSFNDLRSFAEVFYSPESNLFLAVTLLRNRNNLETEVRIFAIAAPPENVEAEAPALTTSHKYWGFLGGIALVLAAIVVIRVKKGNKKPSPHKVGLQTAVTASTDNDIVEETSSVNNSQQTGMPKAYIFLFGELQLITENGNEIVNAFTTLTKELFVYLVLHSIKWDRGVSSEKLNEILWFDKDEKSARNNRSVNIAKLKRVLDQMGHCSVSKDTGYWKVEIDQKYIDVDYCNYLNIISNKEKIGKQKIIQLNEITQRGSLLSNCEYEWLDQYKSEISNEIIDTYLKFAADNTLEDDPEFFVKIANYIFHLDPVNEEAMELKCKALVFLGKHSLAKTTFENFKKEYRNIYAEDFKKDFQSILK